MRPLSVSEAGLRACAPCGAAVAVPALWPCRAPRVRLPAAVLISARAYAGPGTVGPDVARAGTAYAGTGRIRQSITSARNVARPEVLTPSCGYTGLPEAELPSRAVRDRSPVVATRGYRIASEEN